MSRLKGAAVDVVGLFGAALVIKGLHDIYAPAAWIIGGAALVFAAWRASR